jgi:hypothetical protein
MYRQFDGLYDGYAAAAPTSQLFSKDVIYAVNIVGDLEDLCPAMGCLNQTLTCASKDECLEQYNREQRNITTEFAAFHRDKPIRRKDTSHCSILIKPLGDINAPSDIAFAHTTWGPYATMGPRIMKMYDFSFRISENNVSFVPATTIVFSGYPASTYSGDDWYTMNSGMLVMETTIINNNSTLYDSLTPSSVLVWCRAMVANRLANSGKSYTEWIARENSGTYNNAWHALDLNKWTPQTSLPERDLFWHVELMPGLAFPVDLSDVLKTQGYWGSYNRIYNKFLSSITMQDYMEEQFGGKSFGFERNGEYISIE